MANISSANGTCRIIAPTQEDCLKLYHILCKAGTGKWQYSTYYGDVKDGDKPGTLTDGRTVLSVWFDGYGRWSFASNIEATFRWLQSEMTEEEWKFVTDTTFELEYEYTDSECGMRFLNDELVVLRHKVGQDPTESEVFEDIQEEYPFTPFWLAKKLYGGNIDEALDGEFAFDFIDESEQKDLFDISIEDYMSYLGLSNAEAKNRLFEDSDYFKKTFGGND